VRGGVNAVSQAGNNANAGIGKRAGVRTRRGKAVLRGAARADDRDRRQGETIEAAAGIKKLGRVRKVE
jgi:hypothetical protein